MQRVQEEWDEASDSDCQEGLLAPKAEDRESAKYHADCQESAKYNTENESDDTESKSDGDYQRPMPNGWQGARSSPARTAGCFGCFCFGYLFF